MSTRNHLRRKRRGVQLMKNGSVEPYSLLRYRAGSDGARDDQREYILID